MLILHHSEKKISTNEKKKLERSFVPSENYDGIRVGIVGDGKSGKRGWHTAVGSRDLGAASKALKNSSLQLQPILSECAFFSPFPPTYISVFSLCDTSFLSSHVNLFLFLLYTFS